MVRLLVTQHPTKKHSEIVTGVSWSGANELVSVADDEAAVGPLQHAPLLETRAALVEPEIDDVALPRAPHAAARLVEKAKQRA